MGIRLFDYPLYKYRQLDISPADRESLQQILQIAVTADCYLVVSPIDWLILSLDGLALEIRWMTSVNYRQSFRQAIEFAKSKDFKRLRGWPLTERHVELYKRTGWKALQWQKQCVMELEL